MCFRNIIPLRTVIEEIDTYADTVSSQRRVVPQLDLFVKPILEATPERGQLVICHLKDLVSGSYLFWVHVSSPAPSVLIR